MPVFDFKPLTPPRENNPRALAYLQQWHDHVGGSEINADEPPLPFSDVLAYIRRRILPEDAVTVTSFMGWLGNGVGGAFLRNAAELARVLKKPDDSNDDYCKSYAAAWGAANMESRMTLHGTDRETVMAVIERGELITARQIIVLEATAAWLGRPVGQRFIADAETRANHIKPHSSFMLQHVLVNPPVIGS